MAEELGSRLGFDVSEAVTELNKLKRAFDQYSSNITKIAGDSAKFNKEQAQVDTVLKRVSTSAQLAAAQLKQFASAQKSAARESETFIRAQRDQLKFFTTASKAQLAGEGQRGPLAGFVDQNRAQRQQQAADLRNQLREQEQALRNAFRGPPPVPPIAAGLAAEGDKAKRTISDLGVSWKGLLRIFATQIAFQALGNFIGAIREATASSIDFELQLARIGTISEEFAVRGLDSTADTISQLSAQFGTPIEDAAAGLYNILSDQIETAAEATEVFAVANELAAATGANAADTASLLTGVLNAYGLEAGNAREISDQLFVTVDRGRVTIQNIAQTFGRLTPLAAQLGIGFDELNASLAELTIQGVKESDAITQLTNIMLKLIKPTTALQAEFDRLGISSAEAGIAIFGFEGFLREVTANAGESASEIGELFNQIRGTRGVIGIISRDAEDFAETLNAIRTASEGAGATAEAFQRVQGTAAQRVKQELTELRNFLVDDIGRGILQFAALAAEVVDARTAFVAFSAVVIPLGVVFGAGGLVLLIGQFIGALSQMGIQLKLVQTEIVLTRAKLLLLGGTLAAFAVPIGLFAIGATLNAISDQAARAEEASRQFAEAGRLIAAGQVEALQAVNQERRRAVQESIRLTANEFRQRQIAYQKDKAEALRAQEDITADFKAQLEERQGALTSFLSQLRDVQRDAPKNIKELQQDILDIEFSVNTARFERDFRKVSEIPAQASQALISRSNQVLRAAQDAIRQGNVDFGKNLFSEALDLANRAADVTGRRAAGEDQVNRVLNEQKAVNAELIRQEQEKAAAAAKAEQAARTLARRTVTQISRINEINEEIEKEQLAPGKQVDQDRLRALVVERDKLTQEVDNALSSISNTIRSSPALKFLEPLAADLTRAFVNPLNNSIGTLTQTTRDSFSTVLQTLQRQADQTPINIRIQFKALTGEDLGVEGFGAAETAAATLSKELQQGIANEQNIPTLTNNVQNATQRFNEFIASMRNTNAEAKNFQDFLSNATFGAANFAEAFQGDIIATGSFNERLSEFQNQANRALQQGDFGAITDLQNRLTGLIETLQTEEAGKGFADRLRDILGGNVNQQVLTQLQGLKSSLGAAAEAQLRLNDARKQGQNVQRLETAVTKRDPEEQLLLQTVARVRAQNQQVFQEINKFPQVQAQAITAAATEVNKYSEQHIIDERKRIIAELNANPIPAPATAGGATAQGQELGGLIHYFKRGGFSPRGTDTVPAMLSPGEFVVNSRSARKFYSELVAINAGVRPVYRAEGGPIGSTTNVGDIVINVPESQSGRVSGRSLAKELRRELRRQTSRLN